MACSNTLGSIWPDDLYITCGAGQLIEPGAASSVFPTMEGWKIRVIRGSLPLWVNANPSNGSPYCDYSALSGEATWSTPPVDGEEFIIQAYKPLS